MNIVFCADGTWNGTSVDEDADGLADHTNVLKAFHLLEGDTSLGTRRLKDEDEKTLAQAGQVTQVAKYIHGVGDSSNPILRVVGGAFGAGLVARIVRGYTFISRHYSPGDQISVLGFSRGAYTARALAGMIAGVGLLDRQRFPTMAEDKELAYNLGLAAWRTHRENQARRQQDRSIREAIADMIARMPGQARIPLRPGDLVPDVPVHAVGVWDTVGALGLPSFGSDDGSATDAYRFTDDVLSARVRHGFHAVSLDEQRVSFLPTLWQAREGVEQVLFPGAHADVGGGYPERESDLSNIALDWMIRKLSGVGVRFRQPPQWSMNEAADIHEPWTRPLFASLPKAPRTWKNYPVSHHPCIAIRQQKRAALGMQPIVTAQRAPGLQPAAPTRVAGNGGGAEAG